MASQPNSPTAQSALRAALVAQAVELGIDPDSVWCPSPHAIAGWRPDGSLLRIEIAEWPARGLTR